MYKMGVILMVTESHLQSHHSAERIRDFLFTLETMRLPILYTKLAQLSR